MFIPGASLDDVLAVLKDYDRYKDFYPEVTKSKKIGVEGDVVRGYCRLEKTQMITMILNTNHEVRFSKVDDKRWYVRSRSTRIAEVQNPGKPDERELPVGEDNGYLWRMNGYWLLEQADDGVFAQLVSLSLSRDIPLVATWMVEPFIQALPRDSVTSVLKGTRKAVKERTEQRQPKPEKTPSTSSGDSEDALVSRQ